MTLVSASLDMQGLNSKIDRLRKDVRLATVAAIHAGYGAAVGATPAVTGFLRASWYIRANGAPMSHPNPPDYDVKRISDDERMFRRLPMQGPRRNVFMGDDEDMDWDDLQSTPPIAAFISVYMNPQPIFDASTQRFVILSNPFAAEFALVNEAIYASTVDIMEKNEGYVEDARYAANEAVHALLSQIKSRGAIGEAASRLGTGIRRFIGI